MIEKRLLTALILVGVFLPIYFIAPIQVIWMLAILLSYGLCRESFGITFGFQYAYIYAFIVVLMQWSALLYLGTITTFLHSPVLDALVILVGLLWLFRTIDMLFFKRMFSPLSLCCCQILDISVFMYAFMALYLFDKVFLLSVLIWIIGVDSFGYIVGSLYGCHPAVTKISPKKTIEGYLGSFVWSFVYGVILMIAKQMSILALTLFLVMVYIFSITGDLLVSYQKRLLNVKDSGTLLPGHGGLLDRFDSWLFVLAFMHYMLLIN